MSQYAKTEMAPVRQAKAEKGGISQENSVRKTRRRRKVNYDKEKNYQEKAALGKKRPSEDGSQEKRRHAMGGGEAGGGLRKKPRISAKPCRKTRVKRTRKAKT